MGRTGRSAAASARAPMPPHVAVLFDRPALRRPTAWRPPRSTLADELRGVIERRSLASTRLRSASRQRLVEGQEVTEPCSMKYSGSCPRSAYRRFNVALPTLVVTMLAAPADRPAAVAVTRSTSDSAPLGPARFTGDSLLSSLRWLSTVYRFRPACRHSSTKCNYNAYQQSRFTTELRIRRLSRSACMYSTGGCPPPG